MSLIMEILALDCCNKKHSHYSWVIPGKTYHKQRLHT